MTCVAARSGHCVRSLQPAACFPLGRRGEPGAFGPISGKSRTRVCESCPDSRDPPPWRVRATAATHEAQQQTITYRDVLLEAFGVPVMYLPWARFKDFSVRRAKGFLLPAVPVGPRSVFGVWKLPISCRSGPSQDLLLRSGYSTREGPAAGWSVAPCRDQFRLPRRGFGDPRQPDAGRRHPCPGTTGSPFRQGGHRSSQGLVRRLGCDASQRRVVPRALRSRQGNQRFVPVRVPAQAR